METGEKLMKETFPESNIVTFGLHGWFQWTIRLVKLMGERLEFLINLIIK